MKSYELKNKFFDFFIGKGHTRIPNSSLVPENDPSALFINSGMHPLVNYLLGEPHPAGKRLVNCQRCIRTVDLENVGLTKRHHTFFEMLGEWSLDDYWKEESLEWCMEFIVNILGLNPERLYATIFRGNSIVPSDNVSLEVWKKIFKKYGINPTIGDTFDVTNCPRIILLDENDNFWPKGKNIGPCGPCSEIYYDLGSGNDADSRFLELCNNVFMEYYQDQNGEFKKLKQRNVDVGWGLERILSVIQNVDIHGNVESWISNFETDLFYDSKSYLLKSFQISDELYKNNSIVRRDVRAILDHVRASVVITADGVLPSNKDRGYILRRLIRRALTFMWKYNPSTNLFSILENLIDILIENLSSDIEYKLILSDNAGIKSILLTEAKKFLNSLNNGVKIIQSINTNTVDGKLIFNLKTSLGIPLEVTKEIASKLGKTIDLEGFDKLMIEHQTKSRSGGSKKFVGALGTYPLKYKCLHTCAHLFLAGAKIILGDFVCQRGQDINLERLRYDFEYPFDQKIDESKIKEIEIWVNKMIEMGLVVDSIKMKYDQAIKLGVQGVFHDKYKKLEEVTIYRIYQPEKIKHKETLAEEDKDKYVSLEFCSGPHVSNTLEIKNFGKFSIIKQESIGKGIRRIKGVLI